MISHKEMKHTRRKLSHFEKLQRYNKTKKTTKKTLPINKIGAVPELARDLDSSESKRLREP